MGEQAIHVVNADHIIPRTPWVNTIGYPTSAQRLIISYLAVVKLEKHFELQVPAWNQSQLFFLDDFCPSGARV